MKKLLSVITAAAVLLGSTIAYASASEPLDEPTVETYADTSDVEDQAALLRYYELEDGSLRVNSPAYSYQCDKLTNVVIPAEKDGKKVTQIGSFRDCRNLTSVTIPEGVTSIDISAFSCCTSLISVTIPESVTSIGNSAFSGCTSLMSITIPDGVIDIGVYAFLDCSKLTTVMIPDGVTTIGSNAFGNCTSLTEISLPKTVISLGGDYISDRPHYDTNVFYGCTALKGVNVAEENPVYFSFDGVLYAKNKEYNEAYNANKDILVWYPQGREEGSYTIPENVISIADGAIDNRQKLENIFVDPNNEWYKSIDGVLFSYGGGTLEQYPAGKKQAHYKIPDGVGLIEEDAFNGCTNLNRVTMPDGILTAFFTNCTNLKTINLPQSVRRGGFSNCTNIKSIVLPDGITEANFRGCTNLETINFPSSLKYMYFDYCSSLTSEVVIPENVRVFSFEDCKSLTSVMIPDSITEIDSNAFRGCENLTSLKMSKSVSKIGFMAFWGCKSLASIRIPNSVTDIAYGAFGCCTNLKSVNIPQSVKSIGGSAFQDCTSLTSARISNNVEKIDYYTFAGCTNLEWVFIPSDVTDIYGGSFNNCQKLTDIYYSGTEEQWENLLSRSSGSAEQFKNANIHYNSTGPNIVETPIEIDILKPVDDAPETANMQVTVKQGDSIIDTIPINDDGTLDISGVPDGDYTFTFSADNCAPREYLVEVLPGSVTGLEDGVELRLYGDIDDKGDGIVDIRDVAKANMYFKTGEGLSGYMLTVSDVNSDNVINIKDVALMNAHFKQTGNLWSE